MQKKVSVIIPTYMRPALLLRCLDALDRQTLSVNDFEVIVVHDGPDLEGSLPDPEQLDYRFSLIVIHTDEKKGPAAARNMGWLMARYPLIAFTDDDCVPDVNWLTELLNGYCFESFIAYTGKTIVPRSQAPSDYEQNTAGLETADFITANCACTKLALIKAGGFDHRFGMAWREDSDLEFRLISCGVGIKRNDRAIVVHPVPDAAWGVSLKEQKKGMYDVLLFKKYPALYREKIRSRPLWNYYVISMLGLVSVVATATGNRGVGKIAAAAMLIPVAVFFFKRIRFTRKSVPHIAEMMLTSLLIPFVSLYWRAYGIFKFKKLLW